MDNAQQQFPNQPPAMPYPDANGIDGRAPTNPKIIITILSFVLIALIAAVSLFAFNLLRNGSNKTSSSREQEYLNNSPAPSDTLSFFLKDYEDKSLNIFIGIKFDHISDNLTFSIGNSLRNNYIEFVEYGNLSLTFRDSEMNQYSFSSGSLVYRPAEASINKDEIVYNSGNYYVTRDNNLNLFSVFYKYGTSTRDGYESEDGGEVWRLLELGLYDTESDALRRVDELSGTTEICVYTDAEGISKCENTKFYNNLNDILMKKLLEEGIFVKSYRNISELYSSEVSIIDDAREVRFMIGFAYGGSGLNDSKTFEVNGKKYYSDYRGPGNRHIYLPVNENGSEYIDFYVNLDDGVNKTEEEVIKIFKEITEK